MRRRSLTCHIAYDVEPNAIRPHAGELLHTVTQRGTGSVYLITAARLVRRRRRKGPLVRYMLACQRWPGLPPGAASR